MPESTPPIASPTNCPASTRIPDTRCSRLVRAAMMNDTDAVCAISAHGSPGIEMLGEAVKILAELPGEDARFYRHAGGRSSAPM